MYFTVKESHDECSHVATLNASTDRELSEKLQKALNEHFDEDVKIIGEVKMNKCDMGQVSEVSIELEDYSTQVDVTETWLY
jgi:hypothetical protein